MMQNGSVLLLWEMIIMPENIKEMYNSLEAAVNAAFGWNAGIVRKDRIYGGDINDSYRISLSTGETVFAKTNSIKNFRFFVTESNGLRALRATEKIGVPAILGMGIDEKRGFSFLLLEYIESTARVETYWETFGHQLAQLHRAECSQLIKPAKSNARYGFTEDNFIGSSPQKNTPKAGWIDFYRECRLLPQIKMAESYLDAATRRKADCLLDHLDSYLSEPEFPSLLHGDLWSGNTLCGNDGKAWILDPAAYVGHFETDLAMTQLFGSFPSAFYGAYHEINPIDKGYSDRKNLYHLYHLLNHLNLFGRTYLGSVIDILNAYV